MSHPDIKVDISSASSTGNCHPIASSSFESEKWFGTDHTVKNRSRPPPNASKGINSKDILKLIEHVQARNELWNHKSVCYHNREMRSSIWKQIAKEMGLSCETVKTKWGCLRDSFRREMKKRKDPDYRGQKPEWPFYEKLMFLAPFTSRKTRENLTCLENGPTMFAGLSENENDSDIMEMNPVEDPEDDYRQEVFPTLSPSPPTNNQSNKIRGYKKKTKSWKKKEDYHFLMSLFSSMKRIPDHRKLESRIKIMNVISDILGENPSQNQSSSQTIPTFEDALTSAQSQFSAFVKEEHQFD